MKCRQMLWCTVICTDSRVSPQGRPGLAVRVLLFGRGVTWVPKSRNNYMPRFVFYRKMRPLFQKTVFLDKKRKSTALIEIQIQVHIHAQIQIHGGVQA